jgi:hypothetical protein
MREADFPFDAADGRLLRGALYPEAWLFFLRVKNPPSGLFKSFTRRRGIRRRVC